MAASHCSVALSEEAKIKTTPGLSSKAYTLKREMEQVHRYSVNHRKCKGHGELPVSVCGG